MFAYPYIHDTDAISILREKYDWNDTPRSSFVGRTTGHKTFGNTEVYSVVLDDEVPGIVVDMKPGCIKYEGPSDDGTPITADPVNDIPSGAVTEHLLDNAVKSSDDEDDVVIDLNLSNGWVYVDTRFRNDSFPSSKSKITLNNYKHASPLDYFLFFLPLEYFRVFIQDMNAFVRFLKSWPNYGFIRQPSSMFRHMTDLKKSGK